jgi:hypothetical protein
LAARLSLNDRLLPLELVQSDPLLRRLIGHRLLITYLFVQIAYIILIALGIWISIYYQSQGRYFLSLLNPQELAWNIFIYIIVFPVLWLFYIWQPVGYLSSMHHLEKNAVLRYRRNRVTIDEIIRSSFENTNQKFISLLRFSITVLAFVIWLNQFLSPANPFVQGYNLVWININLAFFWFVWMPLNFVAWYLIAWLIIRQLTIIESFAELYRHFDVSLKLYHIDKCNGFAPVGDFAIRFAFLSVLLGIWVYVVISLPIFFGGHLNFKFDTFLLLAVYTLAVPIVLVPPVLRTHKAMADEKNKELELIAHKIQRVVGETSDNKILMSKNLLSELELRYQLLERELKTWPFRPFFIQGFGISALTPLASTGISFLLDHFLLRK